MAPSPSVFLAAVAQRTENLRFGPMVYALPLYHPLRLAEEICMLDQMSGGRLDLGFGRGASPIEIDIFGRDPKDSQEIYLESLEIILMALKSGHVDYQGKFFKLNDVPVALEPRQVPHPPFGMVFTPWIALHARGQKALMLLVWIPLRRQVKWLPLTSLPGKVVVTLI